MSRPLRVALATICLNEAEHLPGLLQQHLDWPGLIGWVLVEGATGLYGQANPGAVSATGLSTDATSSMLAEAAVGIPLVHYVAHGWSDGPTVRSGQQKEVLRNAYCEVLDRLNPDVVVVVDADEMYTERDQRRINSEVSSSLAEYNAWLFRQRHLWRPPSIAARRVSQFEVVGGYWKIPHLRVFKWSWGARYNWNHNWIDLPGTRFDPAHTRRVMGARDPQCVHLGFARSETQRVRTNRFYVKRGEAATPKRRWYTECRSAWENWKPGDTLPHGAKAQVYTGPVPEVLR